MAEILAHGPPCFSSAVHILAVPIVWSTFTLHGAGCHFLNLKRSSKGFPNETLAFFHQLECKPHMTLSWLGSILRAFSRDSELVLPVLILLPGLRAEHLHHWAVWNGKRAGTMAETLCVGEITPGERPEKGIKRQSHVQSWRRRGEDRAEERSGEKAEVQSQTWVSEKRTVAATEPHRLFWEEGTGRSS